jgi:hypothetical protein
MTHRYLNLTDLVAAANGCECLVHLHTDDKGLVAYLELGVSK